MSETPDSTALTNEIDTLFDGNERVGGNANNHPLLKEAQAAGLVRPMPNGAMNWTSEGEGMVDTAIGRLPHLGTLYPYYERVPDAGP